MPLFLPATHSLFYVLSNRCPPLVCFPLQVPFQRAPQPRADRTCLAQAIGNPGGEWEGMCAMGREDSCPFLVLEARRALRAGG